MLIRTHTTGIHHNDERVEWTVLRKTRGGVEPLRRGSRPIPRDQHSEPLFPAQVLGPSHKEFRGVITLSLPSSQLFMQVLELPSSDPDELQGMIELQLDQRSPYPLDQMAVSYEVLQQTADHSRVLALAAQRQTIDALGEQFKAQHVYIHSLDAEILAWWNLIREHGELPSDGRVILMVKEHTEFSMVWIDRGTPVAFRSLHLFQDLDDPAVWEELLEEIRYTQLALDARYPMDAGARIQIWSKVPFPAPLTKKLRTVANQGVSQFDLSALPSLAEGLAWRSADRACHHVELVPSEWIAHQRRRQLVKISTIVSATVLSIWFALVAVVGTVYAVYKSSVEKTRQEAAQYVEPARIAQDARAEKDSLEKYADRSHSALECLREMTELLPDTLELNSFDYTKEKAIRLRGSGARSETIYDYFQKLGTSDRFVAIKDEKQSLQIQQGQRKEGFSVTVQLPKRAKEELAP